MYNVNTFFKIKTASFKILRWKAIFQFETGMRFQDNGCGQEDGITFVFIAVIFSV
jgi:hypothetical protein